MVELIVTMIVIGILAVVVLPRMDLLGGFDEVGYRDKVRATLEYARKAAVAQRRNVCVQLSGNNLTLTIENVVPESSPAAPAQDCSTGLPANAYARALTLPAPDSDCAAANQICAPANVTLAQNALATGALFFRPLGAPSAAATYTVTGQSALSITVEAVTGYVH